MSPTPEQAGSKPAGLTISIRGVALVTTAAVVAGAAWTYANQLTESGAALDTAIRATEHHVRTPGNSPLLQKVHFEPIRHTRWSQWSHAMSGAAAPSGEGSDPEWIKRSHGTDAMMATSTSNNNCTVTASAQSIESADPADRQFFEIVGVPEDALFIKLTHEVGHCLFSSAMALETKSTPDVDIPSLIGLATHLDEAFADAYAIIVASRVDPSLQARAIEALITRRGLKGANEVHQTTASLASIIAMLPSLPGPTDSLVSRWEVTERYAVTAAATGAIQWRMAQGKSHGEARTEVQALLQLSGFTSEERVVNGSPYLTVRRARQSDGRVAEVTP